MRRGLLNLIVIAGLVAGGVANAQAEELASLEGTWVMEQAYEIRADGTRTTNYGEHPKGLLTIDHVGHYNLQIFKIGRPVFANGDDRTRGTPEEYRAVVLGSSTHFGTVMIDRARHQLVFNVEAASFPNWEGKRQVRDFTYDNGILSYAVPASASGGTVTAYSVWRRTPN